MLGTLLSSTVDDGTNGYRDTHLPAQHMTPLSRLVDDLI